MEIRLLEGGKVQEGKEGELKTVQFTGFRRPEVGIAQTIHANDFEQFKVNLELYLQKQTVGV